MSHNNNGHHAPLTMNLGVALQAAGVAPSKKGIPAHLGIDLVVAEAPARELCEYEVIQELFEEGQKLAHEFVISLPTEEQKATKAGRLDWLQRFYAETRMQEDGLLFTPNHGPAEDAYQARLGQVLTSFSERVGEAGISSKEVFRQNKHWTEMQKESTRLAQQYNAAQKTPSSGDKNNEPDTGLKNNFTKENNIMNTQNNGTVSVNGNGSESAARNPQPAAPQDFSPEVMAQRGLAAIERLTEVAAQAVAASVENDKRRTDALVAVANEVAPTQRRTRQFARHDRTGMKMIVTGTFAIAGGVGAGIAVQHFVPGATSQDTMGAVSLGTIGGIIIGAGVSEAAAGLLDTRAEKKAAETKVAVVEKK